MRQMVTEEGQQMEAGTQVRTPRGTGRLAWTLGAAAPLRPAGNTLPESYSATVRRTTFYISHRPRCSPRQKETSGVLSEGI